MPIVEPYPPLLFNKMKLNCLLIEDQLIDQMLVAGFLKKIENINLIGVFDDALKATHLFKEKTVHFVICDIELPTLNGLEFFESLIEMPYFIFISSNQEYAAQCFELNAIDFISKPITLKRLEKAIEKVTAKILHSSSKANSTDDDYFFVKVDGKFIRIDMENLLYIEAQKDYVKLAMENGKNYLVLMNLKHIEDQLPADLFVRTHRSFLVNLNKIDIILREEVIVQNQRIPLGASYSETLTSLFKDKTIKK